MRLAVAVSLTAAALLAAPVAATAAPLALSDHATVARDLNAASVEKAGWRGQARRCARRGSRICGWQCQPYWRPYQYHYWQEYYPYGGPLF